MQYKDYYKVLDVTRGASLDDIKKSYRKLARKYHPDVSKEPNAEERFKDVQEAYEVLKDEKKRAAYDQLGNQWREGQEFRPPPNWHQQYEGFEEADLGDFSDFFASIFGGGRVQGMGGGFRHARGFDQRGQDEKAKLNITLEEAYHGASKTIRLQMQNNLHTLKVNIPKGAVSGQQLRLAQQGSPGMGNAPAGDLYLEIEILPHKLFTVQGKDIYLTLPITPWEAGLGAKISVPTLGGLVDMKIQPGAQGGQKLRLKGRGLSSKTTSGDQYVLLQIVTPPVKNPEQQAFYEKMAKEFSFNPREGMY